MKLLSLKNKFKFFIGLERKKVERNFDRLNRELVVNLSKTKIKQKLPLYSLTGESGELIMPSVKEVVKQYLNIINPKRDRSNWLNLHLELIFYITLFFMVDFIWKKFSLKNLILFITFFYLLANIYNTFWYHRYCSHYSFKFSNTIIPKIFLWFNPVSYREESYVLNHILHHQNSDTKDDPYGPHYGWLGNFFASPFFKVKKDISLEEFEQMKRRLEHTGIIFSSYENFKKWGSVEYIPHYLVRNIFSNLFWMSVMTKFGGIELLTVWYASIFAFHTAARDFNYRGHGGYSVEMKFEDGRDFDRNTLALNYAFYGFLAGEWHNNHHAFQSSANNGFLPYQLDIPFLIIKFMYKIGLVNKYNDSTNHFLEKYFKNKLS